MQIQKTLLIMMTEKEKLITLLKSRGIIKEDGAFDKLRFNKLVTEPWIYQKVKYYNLDKDLTEAHAELINSQTVPDIVPEYTSQSIDNQSDMTDSVQDETTEAEEVKESVVTEDIIPEEPAKEEKKEAGLTEVTEIPVEPVSVTVNVVKEEKLEKKPSAKKSAKKS